MEPLLLVAGAVILLATVVDALSTTVAPDTGGGFVTGRVAHGTWWLSRQFVRQPGGWLARATGPVVAVATVATWLVGLWLGWFLVFSASPTAVVADADGTPADGWTRLYFAGFTVFTLGVGDQVPAGSPWQVATVLGSVSGLVFTTLAITFLLPVVTAVTQRRQQACRIAGLGDDAQAIVVNGWDGSGFGPLEQVLPDLANDMLLTAERRLAYPILAYFHAAAPAEDHRVQLVAIDEAATLLRCAVDPSAVEVPALPARLVRHAVVQQLERAAAPIGTDRRTEPLALDLDPLREAGIPTVSDDDFERAVTDDAEHRTRLAALVAATGWRGQVAARTHDGRP